ncbi:unnamed protein product [Caenorhabditis angaria]|uniref:Uncharacterized protein n=1 Tax=Caenorhabditis angaria TaxID=860376 RepID=A0A9P1I8K1_9PELO|nr:unnamed protein product [Caenorhabditis angaria]
MKFYITFLIFLAFFITSTYSATFMYPVKVGDEVTLVEGSGPLRFFSEDHKEYTFNFSGPNRGFFTDNKTKKRLPANNLRIKGNDVIITKITKADAGHYERGGNMVTVIVE